MWRRFAVAVHDHDQLVLGGKRRHHIADSRIERPRRLIDLLEQSGAFFQRNFKRRAVEFVQ